METVACFVVEYELLLWVLIVADNVTIANAETLLAVLPNDRYETTSNEKEIISFLVQEKNNLSRN